MSAPVPPPADIWRRRLLMSLPLAALGAAGGAFYAMLMRMEEGRFNPHDIGNPMLGQALPDFTLAGLDGAGFSAADLRQAAQAGGVVLNFFASWCIPCIQEAPALAALAQSGVRIWGIAYKDKPDALRRFLGNEGNPFTRLALDPGRTAIDFGLSGVPESFVINRQGVITWHVAGPLSDDIIATQLRPALAAA